MKATLSKDGLMRFDIKIKRRVALDDMINGLGWNLIRDNEFHDIPNKAMAVEAALIPFRSRKAIMEATAKAYWHDGDSIWTWTDDCSFAEIIREQARCLILKKFPELKQPTK